MRRHARFWLAYGDRRHARRRAGAAAAAGAILLAVAGCSTGPKAACLDGRPAWSLNDDAPTIRAKTMAAAHWDRRCTLVGVISSATAPRADMTARAARRLR